jgi:glycosyltransferase involved in cell wall biosynthesis
MKKILYLGDYVARTGFGTVSHNIICEVKKHYREELQLDIIAINYFGDPYYEDERTFVVSAVKNDVNQDSYGRFFFLKMLKEGDYDGVFICQDIGIVQPLIEVMEVIKREKKENNQKQFKSIFYFPVDCPMVKQLTKGLEFFDVLATYTEYGREIILDYRPELKTKIHVVPHGNNPKDFYPLEKNERESFRKEFFGENANKFIITNVNRNQPRKDIPTTILAFQEAKDFWSSIYDLPKPFLYLHMHPRDPKGWDLRLIFEQTNLVEDVDYKLLPPIWEQSGCETDVLNKIYNASDVMLTTSVSEGWGLTVSEAAACKIPVIAPMHTSFTEMLDNGKRGYMIEDTFLCCHNIDSFIRFQVDYNDVADMIKRVAIDKRLKSAILSQKVDAAYEWSQKLQWSIICKRWIEYFKIF